MLRALEALAVRPPEMTEVPALVEALGFLRVFVDACHHHKEEQLLFPALASEGISAAVEPIESLLAEHERGRALVSLLAAHLERAQEGEARALGGVGGLLGEYAHLLHAHIATEERIVFAMADEELPPEVQAELAEGYESVEREVIGQGRHEAFHELLDRLEATYLPS
jgi:hemerythrin-like domain-containing protein